MGEDRTIISFNYAIKTVLRDKANFDILEGFLSELLERKVTVHGILESESNRRLKGGKTNRVDLKAKIDDGEVVIFEIQFADQVDFFGKILFSSSKAIVEQIGAGKNYDIKKVYSINIAYFDLGAKREYMFHADMFHFNGLHYKEEQIPFAQNEELAPPPISKKYIHPEYYLILPNKFDEQIRRKFDEWVYVLKNSVVKSEFSASGIMEAGIRLDELKMTKTQRAAYDKFLMDRQSIDSAIWTAEAEGRMKEKLENAKAMKNEGFDINIISKITRLSIEEVQKL